MAKVMDAANRDRFLTVRWNNALVAGLGLPTLAYAAPSSPLRRFSTGPPSSGW